MQKNGQRRVFRQVPVKRVKRHGERQVNCQIVKHPRDPDRLCCCRGNELSVSVPF